MRDAPTQGTGATHLGMRLPPRRRVALPPPPLLLRARRRAGRPAVPVVAPDPQRDLLGAAPKHHRNAEIFRLSGGVVSKEGMPTMPSDCSGRVSWQLLRRQSVPLERAGPRHQLAGRARLRTAPRRAAVEFRAPLVPETVATGTVVAGKRLFEESPGPDQTISRPLRAAAQGLIQSEELGEPLLAKTSQELDGRKRGPGDRDMLCHFLLH